jgi:cysteine-rich repeat protein
MQFDPRSVRVAALVVSLALGCSGTLVERDVADASVAVTVNALGTQIALVVIAVEAPDVPAALVFNLPIVDGRATGTLHIPAGANRTITARAFESDGAISHEGSVTLAVVDRGFNAPVSIPMVPRNGRVPVTIVIGSVTVVVSPGDVRVTVGTTLQLFAQVFAPGGEQLTTTPDWASTDPSVLTVNETGLVTAVREGQADVVASYAGTAGVSHVTVAAEGGCGDAIVVGTEECDDGNAASGDGCSSACRFDGPLATPGSVHLTEVMANPSVLDTVGEWLELYNGSALTLDLRGCIVRDNVGSFVLPTLVVAPGEFVVLGNSADPAVNGGVPVDVVFPSTSGLQLSNGTDGLAFSCGDTVLSSHAWSLTVSGVAMQRDPASFGVEPATWCDATVPFGTSDFATPRAANSSCQTSP